MVEVDPRIYDPDGNAVARLCAAPMDDFKGCMGLVGLDHFRPWLVLEFTVFRCSWVISSRLDSDSATEIQP